MNISKLKKNSLFVGRAATGIYLVLNTLMKKKEVIIPSNICYAAVYPIIYSENFPVFVDVDPITGNALYKEIIKKVTQNTGAIIFPYMYGNVSKDILKLKQYCSIHNIILIEDCASAMGANIDEYEVGSIGDYSVFSTGHAKIIDVGNGGILLSDNNIDNIIENYNKLELFDEYVEKKLESFSKEYRQLRNRGDNEKIKEFLQNDYKRLFLYRIDESIIKRIKKEILNFEAINKKRIEKYELYRKNLHRNNKYKLLNYQVGSNPWRFTILLENNKERKDLINILLENKLFVSDWYPCIGKSFSNNIYPNSNYMEQSILNFSLTEDDENILKICKIMNNFFKEK